MKQRTSRILFDYWNELRGVRLAPARFEIEPSRISEILAETFILERGDSASYDYRLAGTRICEQFGTELRGRDFLDLAGPEHRQVLEEAMAVVERQGAVCVLEIEAHDRNDRRVTFEVVVLPLVHGQNGVNRFVGAISAINPPAWLGYEPLVGQSLLSHLLVWPDGRPHAVVQKANRQAPFVPELANARIVRFNRLQFRILDGGKDAGSDLTSK